MSYQQKSRGSRTNSFEGMGILCIVQTMPKSLPAALYKLDEKFMDMVRHFDEKKYFYPLNFEEEKQRFIQACDGRTPYNPIFTYPDLTEKDYHMLEYLEDLKVPDHPVGKFYTQVKQRFVLTLEMAQNRQAKNLTSLSQKKYGIPSMELVQTSQDILRDEHDRPIEDAFFGIRAVMEQLREHLVSLNITDWTLDETQSYIWLGQANHIQKKIYLPLGLLVNQAWIEKIAQQMIEVCVFQGQNARAQPLQLFSLGLDRFEETQWGLMIELAHRTDMIETRTLRRHAGGVLASYLGYQYSFWEVFERLSNIFPQETAYRLTASAKMGLMDTEEVGGLLHTHLPLQGWKKVQSLSMAEMRAMYVGYVGIDQLAWIQEALDEGILHAPLHLPALLKHA